ncbi:hypothetical protein BJ546DRAFT_309706 [Cryomyces antarcticus]
MAVTVVVTAMKLHEEKTTLHRFFVKPQRSRSPERPIEASISSNTSKNPDQKLELEPIEEVRVAGKARAATTHVETEDRPRKYHDVAVEIQSPLKPKPRAGGTRARKPRQTSTLDLAFGDGRLPTVEVQDTESDLNVVRRKRRRTVAPIAPEQEGSLLIPPSTNCHQQLTAGAGTDHSSQENTILVGVSSPSKRRSDCLPEMADIVPATSPQQEFAESSYGPIDSNALLSVPSSPPSKSSPVVTLQPAQDMSYSTVHHGDVLQAPPLNDSPERKMLRLNARGRFSSPVLNRLHQDTAEGTKPKTRKSRRARGQRKHLLVVCAYGSDVSSRTDIARRIEQILKGAMTTNKATSKDLGVPPEPSGPPKPTHPFFLSKSGHSQEPGLTAQSSPGVLSKPRQEQLETRKTSAVTPGKLRSQIQVRQDDRAFSGFGIGAFGSTQDRSMIKHPGACEPAWPSRGAAHVRGPQECPSRPRSRGDESPNSSVVSVVRGQRKLKYKAIRIAEDENIISKFDQALHFSQGDVVDEYGFKRPPAALRIPERLLITGSELEMMVRKRVRAHLPDPVSVVGDPRSTDDELHGSDLSTTHPALSALYGSIADTLTPFDQCRYEQQMWVQKYAPKTADQVLQSRKEVATLRDWLGKLTISAVESGNKPPPNSSTKLENKKPRKKRRKRAEELEGFIVSSDENACDMDELTDPEDAVQLDGLRPLQKRSQVRVGIQDADTSTKFSSATLLSGPHGCGKTAAVFAVAKELGFEVFEINAGSRRSGKDIIDRVGNMSQTDPTRGE